MSGRPGGAELANDQPEFAEQLARDLAPVTNLTLINVPLPGMAWARLRGEQVLGSPQWQALTPEQKVGAGLPGTCGQAHIWHSECSF